MDEKLRKAIQERAYALWEQAGRPEGGDLAYWLEAESEIAGLSVAGEEDPLAGVDEFAPGEMAGGAEGPTAAPAVAAPAAEAALQASVEEAVPAAEQLPTAEQENPISKRVRAAAATPKRRTRAKKTAD